MKTIHQNIVKDKMAFCLFCMYGFVIPFGTVFRFGMTENSLGLSTILLLFCEIIYLPKIIYFLFKKKIFFTFLLLVLWLSFSTLLGKPSIIMAGYKNLVGLIIYLFWAITMTQVDFPEKRLKIFFICLTIGLLISSGLTLIDFFGVFDIPGSNELHIATEIKGARIIQASGFFYRRTAMAANFALILPALIVLATNFFNIFLKVIIIFAYLSSILILFFTHNRGGIIAILFCTTWYFLWGDHIHLFKRIKRIFIAGLFMILIGWLITTYFYEHIRAYLFVLRIPSATAYAISDHQLSKNKASDYMRVVFLKRALSSVFETPVGNGLTRIWTMQYGFTNSHNIITQIIWGAGIFSFIWLGLFGHTIFKLFKAKINVHDNLYCYFKALRYGLFSWLMFGMCHAVIGTGLAWMFFGIMLNICSRYARNNFKYSKELNFNQNYK